MNPNPLAALAPSLNAEQLSQVVLSQVNTPTITSTWTPRFSRAAVELNKHAKNYFLNPSLYQPRMDEVKNRLYNHFLHELSPSARTHLIDTFRLTQFSGTQATTLGEARQLLNRNLTTVGADLPIHPTFRPPSLTTSFTLSNPPIHPRTGKPVKIGHTKKVSCFSFMINANRQVDLASEAGFAKANAMQNAMEKVLKEMLSECTSGRYFTTWYQNTGKNGVPPVPAPWTTQTVIRFPAPVLRLEVGENQQKLHAHMFIGFEHRMMVKFNRNQFLAEFVVRMNRLNETGGALYYFGDPLEIQSVFMSPLHWYWGKTIEQAQQGFEEYVSQNEQDNERYVAEVQRRQHQAAKFNDSIGRNILMTEPEFNEPPSDNEESIAQSLLRIRRDIGGGTGTMKRKRRDDDDGFF